MAKKSATAGAIGAYEAARIYGLNVLAEKIEERSDNQTRFLIISANESPKAGANKTSILFSINDESGALHKILRPFATKNLNLSKIQSRPSPVRKWEYIFFVDFDGNQDSAEALWVFKQIKPQTLFLKSLGSYPQGKITK
jgi:chorismate mutase/prephenate dehydratase